MTDKRFQPESPHPDEWQQDLNPDMLAGINRSDLGADAAEQPLTAGNIGDLKRALPEFTKDELKQIPVLPPGTRLEQGATYIDLATPDRREFTATADIEAGPHNWFVPKSETDYQLWNRLIGVTNPERLGTADDSSVAG